MGPQEYHRRHIERDAGIFVVTRFGFGQIGYPRSVYLIDALLLIVLTSGLRIARRIGYPSASNADMKRVLIYGAGDAGERLVRELRQNQGFGYRPVGFVDDDRRKTGQRIHGVKVLGTRDHLSAIMRTVTPDAILIAMPSIGASAIREIAKALLAYNVSIKILPDLSVLLDGKSEVNQLRNLSVEDLLHRPRVDLDRSVTAALLKGKRVLVTGAGGSIGSELCRQIATYSPESSYSLNDMKTGCSRFTASWPIAPVLSYLPRDRGRNGQGTVTVCDGSL